MLIGKLPSRHQYKMHNVVRRAEGRDLYELVRNNESEMRRSGEGVRLFHTHDQKFCKFYMLNVMASWPPPQCDYIGKKISSASLKNKKCGATTSKIPPPFSYTNPLFWRHSRRW